MAVPRQRPHLGCVCILCYVDCWAGLRGETDTLKFPFMDCRHQFPLSDPVSRLISLEPLIPVRSQAQRTKLRLGNYLLLVEKQPRNIKERKSLSKNFI